MHKLVQQKKMLNLTTEENDKLELQYSARMLDWQGYGWSIISSRHAVAAQCNLGSQFEKIRTNTDGALLCNPSLKSNNKSYLVMISPPVNGCFFVHQGPSGITSKQCQALSCRAEADDCVRGADVFKELLRAHDWFVGSEWKGKQKTKMWTSSANTAVC